MRMKKRRKNTRFRGSKTHGGGSMKKRRGAGHRGGRGAAGSGKRGDAKKPSIWKDKRCVGKRGFTSKSRKARAPITIAHLERFVRSLQRSGILEEQDDVFVVHLDKAGYTRLLATGSATRKWRITVPAASPGAIEKIERAGGSVTLTGRAATGGQEE
ncbi:uL15 family ribosomal protein [Candidatus Woesearchaeota archaeon]|nr:uL15 family ribosomal protein [Candidatus Woesearchaeota archaeon]